MNGILDRQTTGNVWSPPIRAMLHQKKQEGRYEEPAYAQSVVFDQFEKQMAGYEADYQILLSDVARSYVMPKDRSVHEFLENDRSLAAILRSAVPHLKQQFGTTVFALRVSLDEQGWQILCVDALWPGDAAEAYAAVDRFEDAWWIANSRSAAERLLFTYRLV